MYVLTQKRANSQDSLFSINAKSWMNLIILSREQMNRKLVLLTWDGKTTIKNILSTSYAFADREAKVLLEGQLNSLADV